MDKRQAIVDAPAIYFVLPTKQNIEIICKDAANELYDAFYLNWASSIPRDLLEELATQIVKTESTSKIARVFDHFCNFICYDTRMFSLDMKQAFSLVCFMFL